MKRIYALLLGLLIGGSMSAQSASEEMNGKESRFEYGIEMGLYNGLYGKYDWGSSVSLLGQLGLNYYLAYTVPRRWYTTGLTPALNLSAQWFIWRWNHVNNRGLYLSLGIFGDLGRYAVLQKNLFNPLYDWGGQQSYALFIKCGIEVPINKRMNLKAGAMLNGGLMKMRDPFFYSDLNPDLQEKARNEFLFDIGITIPLNR